MWKVGSVQIQSLQNMFKFQKNIFVHYSPDISILFRIVCPLLYHYMVSKTPGNFTSDGAVALNEKHVFSKVVPADISDILCDLSIFGMLYHSFKSSPPFEKPYLKSSKSS